VSWRRLLPVATCLSARCRSRVMMCVTDELRVGLSVVGSSQVCFPAITPQTGVARKPWEPRRVVVCAVQCAAGGMEYREWRVLFRVRGECKWLAGERWRGSNEVTAGLPSVCVGGAAVA
jgi:hypothetical protein